ncbi:hypothetical protein SAMN05444959_1143 [Paracoccus seriniphilus]|uniref:DUF302 domain-containing protein n=2 Tax=Paracoccus seriniphilus TaxID=184748 RepID=A0A239Q010_9RHOB|nr:DUF302 domain-containing protein [Paracoccus seriniphilus]SNT75939.1 hypothetical protein SAMN05444959_1143 [Paracoccus seriniphilus]
MKVTELHITSLLLPFALMLSGVTAQADDLAVNAPVTHQTTGEFEDIVFAVENAILNAGLLIEGHSHVGDMLARTKEDVGGGKDLYSHADVFTFCSASVSRQVMEADILNLQHCPYSIFLFETPEAPGQITVGRRAYGGSMQPAAELLDSIIADALMLD